MESPLLDAVPGFFPHVLCLKTPHGKEFLRRPYTAKATPSGKTPNDTAKEIQYDCNQFI